MKTYDAVIGLVLMSFLGLPASLFAQSKTAALPPLVINNVSIVDVESGALVLNRSVIVAGNTIQRISQGSTIEVPEGAGFIDGTGLFLVPALFDAHVHYVDPATYRPMMIANGVLFVRDMGNPTNQVLAVKRELKAGNIPGPEMITTGSVLDGNPPAISQISIPCETPEEGRSAARAQALAGVDQIKVYSGLRREVFHAIVDEAQKLGVKVVGHIPESVYIEDAAEAGLRSSEHLFGFGKIIAKLLGDPVLPSNRGIGTDVPYFLRLNEVNREEFRRALERIRITGMHVCPTLVVFKHGAHNKEIFAGNYPMLEYASPMTKAMWKAIWGGQPVTDMIPKLLFSDARGPA